MLNGVLMKRVIGLLILGFLLNNFFVMGMENSIQDKEICQVPPEDHSFFYQFGQKSNHLKFCIENFDQISKIIKKYGLDINSTDGRGLTPLHTVMLDLNKKEKIPVLLRLGALVNAKCNDKNTPLFAAVLKKNKDAVLYLLRLPELDINSKNSNQQTALHLACQLGYEEIVTILLQDQKLIIANADVAGKALWIMRYTRAILI